MADMNLRTEKDYYTASDGTVFGYLLQQTGPETDEKRPMLVYLHGGDGIGTDPEKLLNIECVPQYLNNGKLKIKTSAIILAPQCPHGKKWYTVEKELIELIKDIAPAVGADPDRISLTGCSLGGMGTFAAAIAAPDMFSCAVPVCSSVDPEKCAVLTGLPVWIFHGELDSGMGFSAVEANCVINRAGGRSRLTMLPGEGHEIRHVYHDGRKLVKWMLDRRRGEIRGEKKCIFIGSSVCVGTGAPDDRGWSRLLADRLNAEGISTENVSIGGQTTTDILRRLDSDVILRRPDYCIVGLGLANEGLAKTESAEEAEGVRCAFDLNMKRIIAALKKAGIKCCAGGVYPNNNYYGFHYSALLREEKASAEWGIPVFRWLSELDDGSGHWKSGLFNDAGHPSSEGYRVMYSVIPETEELFK
ncbi:MAG: GDSL-type esterase/lipase family protein [Clostridia bacterium]|nr:GDSL-type esterase/lipase family protein [Clostridia bacterium]